jgi:CubicO group peptidase (beta-lactamase class C family)
MKQQILLLVTLLAVPTALPAQESSAPRTNGEQDARSVNDATGEKAWLAHGFTTAQREGLREPFRWGIETKAIPGGALLVIHRGEPVFREAFGVADMETKRPFTVEAPCRIASVTKQYVDDHARRISFGALTSCLPTCHPKRCREPWVWKT